MVTAFAWLEEPSRRASSAATSLVRLAGKSAEPGLGRHGDAKLSKV